jgi:predicted anti-sigma-YlaC factor YlaD
MQQMYPQNNQQSSAQKDFSSEYAGYFPEEKIRVAPQAARFTLLRVLRILLACLSFAWLIVLFFLTARDAFLSGIVLYLATILLTNSLFYFLAAQLQASAKKVELIGAFLVSLVMLYGARFSFVSLGDLVAYLASVLSVALILAAIFFIAIPRAIAKYGH